jgi:SAM-dependent methyltransferase
MQAAPDGRDTDFFADDPFARLDPRDDREFYAAPRFVPHLDATAIARVAALYGRFLRPGMRVLDLMSSWVSHLPDAPAGLAVTGLGLNAEELARNPRLATRVVHDLNAEPRLPFADAAFDAAVCTVSVEYLTRPFEVFAEVARVLAPGAPFVVTFSERWFPSKVVRIWKDLHPFERIGLVIDYFRRSGRYADLHSESIRGLPRPDDDKYADTLALSDPVYAVWGARAAH